MQERCNGLHTSDQTTRVLIFEPNTDGHHGPYLQWIATSLANCGFEVIVATKLESLTHPSIRAIASNAPNGRGEVIRVIPSPAHAFQGKSRQSTTNLLMRELTYWRLFGTWYKIHAHATRPSVVFLPYLDYCLYAIGLLGSPFAKSPWVGLTMRPSFHYHQMGVIAPKPSLAFIKEAIFFRLLTNPYLRCLLTSDEPLVEYLYEKVKGVGKMVFLPEPAALGNLPDAADAKRQLGVPTERKLILVYGAISRRKGVVELLRALAHGAFPPFVDVLIAGQIADDVRALLAEPSARLLLDEGRLRLLDRFIAAEEEPILFMAADIVWLGYRGHYTASGVLSQAANMGRPVLACEEGVIGWQTRRYRLGQVVQPVDTPAVIAAVNSLLERAPSASCGRAYAKSNLGGSFPAATHVLARAMVCGAVSAYDVCSSCQA